MATGGSRKNLRQPKDGDLVVLGQGQGPFGSSPRPSSGTKIVGRTLSSGGFELLPADGSVDSRPSSAASDGRNSAASGRRSFTPSKQVALPTVKRKDENDDYSFGAFNWTEHEQLEETSTKKHLKSGDVTAVNGEMNQLSINEKPVMNGDIGQENSDNSDDDESSSEEEEIKAPNELMMEFVTCMMQQDYVNALKLCKMILLYEPENPEAKEFLPVIEEKMQLDAEAAAAAEEEESGESGDDDEDEDEEADSDDDDDDDDDDDSNSEESSDDDESEDEDDTNKPQATTVIFNLPS